MSFLQKPLKGLWNVKMTGIVNSILDRCKTAIFPALEEGGILQSDWITHQGRIFHSGIVHFLFLHFPDIKLNVMCRNFQAEYKLSRSQLNKACIIGLSQKTVKAQPTSQEVSWFFKKHSSEYFLSCPGILQTSKWIAAYFRANINWAMTWGSILSISVSAYIIIYVWTWGPKAITKGCRGPTIRGNIIYRWTWGPNQGLRDPPQEPFMHGQGGNMPPPLFLRNMSEGRAVLPQGVQSYENF